MTALLYRKAFHFIRAIALKQMAETLQKKLCENLWVMAQSFGKAQAQLLP